MIAKPLSIKVGKNTGKTPSAASHYQVLKEAGAAAADGNLPVKPPPEEADPHERH